jgi:hypothetical protein
MMSAAAALAVLTSCTWLRLAIGQTTAAATTTTTTTLQCVHYNACRNHAECWACLSPLHAFSDHPTFSTLQSRPLEKAFFFSLLNTPECNGSAALVVPAVYDMWWNYCALNVTLNKCQYMESQCRYDDDDCSVCLANMWESSSAESANAANSVPLACNRTLNTVSGATILQGLVNDCNVPRGCTLSKELCARSTECTAGWTALRDGKGTMAAALIMPSTSAAATTMSSVAFKCIGSNTVACQYWRAVCESDPSGNCGGCMRAMNYGADAASIARGRLTSSCSALAQGDSGTALRTSLQRYIDNCPEITWCGMQAFACVMERTNGTQCAQCLLGTSANSSACDQVLANTLFNVLDACSPCPNSVYVTNRIVIATSIIGGLSILPCLAVVAVIVAYGKDRIFIRDRITIGIMVSNAVYSLSNAIPIGLLDTSPLYCGNRVVSFATQKLGRSLWFGGKYALLFYEGFILLASIHALKWGVRTLNWRVEGALHAACVCGGIIAFAVFCGRTAEIQSSGFNAATQAEMQLNTFSNLQPDDDFDDMYPEFDASDRFTSAHDE